MSIVRKIPYALFIMSLFIMSLFIMGLMLLLPFSLMAQDFSIEENAIIDWSVLTEILAPPSQNLALVPPPAAMPKSNFTPPLPEENILTPRIQEQGGQQGLRFDKAGMRQQKQVQNKGNEMTEQQKPNPPPPLPEDMQAMMRENVPTQAQINQAPTTQEQDEPQQDAQETITEPAQIARLPEQKTDVISPITPPKSERDVILPDSNLSFYYEENQSELSIKQAAELLTLAQMLNDNKSLSIIIENFEEESPDLSRSKAKRMALQRARIIRDFLIEQGVERRRLLIQGSPIIITDNTKPQIIIKPIS